MQHLVKGDEKIQKTSQGIAWRLLLFPSDKSGQPLGPLARVYNVDRNTYCTLSLLPESSSKTTVKFDIYCTGNPRTNSVYDFKAQIRKHWAGLEQNHAEEMQSEQACIFQGDYGPPIAYNPLTVTVGSTFDGIDRMLLDHRQQEQRAGKMIDPASKGIAESGESEVAVVCHALERSNSVAHSCPKQQQLGLQLEW